MIKIGIGVLVIAVVITFFALARASAIADRRLEEIQRLTAEREAGAVYGS